MTLFTAEEQARIKSCAILHDIAPELIEQTLAARSDLQSRLPAGSVFLDAGEVRPGLYLIADGTVEVMNIERATAFTFEFYGKVTQDYTMARTVGCTASA